MLEEEQTNEPSLYNDSTAEAATGSQSPNGAQDAAVSWTGPEFVAHDKTSFWFVGLFFGTIVIAAVLYLLTRSIITIAVVVVGGLMMGVYGGREPRQLEYKLAASSLSIGNRHFPYEHFRAFSIIHDEGVSSIDFMPLKRFAPILTVYFHPDDEAAITSLLSNRLPYQDRKLDPIERLMRNLHF